MAFPLGACSTALVVTDPDGLHLRPAATIAQIARQYEADVSIEYDGRRANGKSLLDMCLLAAQAGARLTVSAVGRDARIAIRAIEDAFVRLFGGETAPPAAARPAVQVSDTPLPATKASPTRAVATQNAVERGKLRKKRQVFVWTMRAAEQDVLLVGSFSQWNPLPMTRRGAHFETSVALAPGEYQYKFIVDRQWQNDPAATHAVPNAFGTTNSVVSVP